MNPFSRTVLTGLVSLAFVSPLAAHGDIDISLSMAIPGELPGTFEIPGANSVISTLSVSGGPPGGFAFVAFANGHGPGTLTSFGDLYLDPASIYVLGFITLDGLGKGDVTSGYGSTIPGFGHVFQAATLDPITGVAGLTNHVCLSHGVNTTLVHKANIALNHVTGDWTVLASNVTLGSPPVLVEFYDASEDQTSVLASGTIPPGKIDIDGVFPANGQTSLELDDEIRVYIAGELITKVGE